MTIQELALTESRSLREQYADRTDVLDKVKALALLPDGTHADIPAVARYFEVTEDAIGSMIRRNRDELSDNGLLVLRGAEYREFATVNLTVANPQARSITLFTRRAVLNAGQLLTESPIAKAIRTYLLDVEELVSSDIRNAAVDAAAERAAIARAHLSVLKVAETLSDIDQVWLSAKKRTAIARGLGEEPEVDPLDAPLYVPDFLRDKGLNRKRIDSEQSWFGRRVASLYEAEHGEKPGKRLNDLPNGSLRETTAWTKRDLPLFEEAWDRWYADKYPSQMELIGGGA